MKQTTANQSVLLIVSLVLFFSVLFGVAAYSDKVRCDKINLSAYEC